MKEESLQPREEFERVQQLFHELLDLPEEERAVRLASQPEMVGRRVAELLDAAIREEKDAREARPERHFGPYEAKEVIGRGGMGEVWRAERTDGEVRIEVAIKTLRSAFAPEDFFRRFRSERQLLASLQHPNIARFYDGGVTARQTPYLVMELIRGAPILDYAREAKLSREALVALWEQGAKAVAYAHSRMVLHRDLKPSNLLVAGDGTVKLLDFGTAKLLDPPQESAETSTGQRVFTPQYASPEQILGLPTGTATDVWGLGVLLFELLTGRTPFQLKAATLEELIREICEKDAPAAGVGADLDAILAKALRREPAERYQRVEEMLEDVAAWRENRPVRARKGGWRYRARKFMARNRFALATAAIALGIAAASAVSTWHQYQQARQRYFAMRDLSRAMLNQTLVEISRIPGTLAVQKLLVNRTLDALTPVAARAGSDSELRLELARAYQRLATLQGSPYSENLGEPAKALDSLDRAAALLPPDVSPARQTIELRAAIDASRTGILDSLGRREEAVRAAERALALLEPLPPMLRAKQQEADLRGTLARYESVRNPEKAEAHLRAAGAILENELPRLGLPAGDVLFGRMVLQTSLGDLLLQKRDPARASQEFEKGIAIYQAAAENDRKNALRPYAGLMRKQGNALAAMKRFDEAIGKAREALALCEQVAAGSGEEARGRFDLAVFHNDLALIYESAGKIAECDIHTARSLGYLRPLAASAGPKSAFAAALAEVEERAKRLKFRLPPPR